MKVVGSVTAEPLVLIFKSPWNEIKFPSAEINEICPPLAELPMIVLPKPVLLILVLPVMVFAVDANGLATRFVLPATDKPFVIVVAPAFNVPVVVLPSVVVPAV